MVACFLIENISRRIRDYVHELRRSKSQQRRGNRLPEFLHGERVHGRRRPKVDASRGSAEQGEAQGRRKRTKHSKAAAGSDFRRSSIVPINPSRLSARWLHAGWRTRNKKNVIFIRLSVRGTVRLIASHFSPSPKRFHPRLHHPRASTDRLVSEGRSNSRPKNRTGWNMLRCTHTYLRSRQ